MAKLAIDWESLQRRRDWAERPPSLRVQVVPSQRAEEMRLVGAAVSLAELLVVVTVVGLVWSLMLLGGW